MKRRDFIALAAGAALPIALPHAARAQAPTPPTVGFLDAAAEDDGALAAFHQGLQMEQASAAHQSAAVEYRSAAGNDGRLPGLATDLVGRNVAVLAANGRAAALAAKAATTTIPIVFAVDADPVQLGLVGNLYRPGGHITGVVRSAPGLEQKRLELLRTLLPAVKTVALLVDPTNPDAEKQAQNITTAADALGLNVHVLHASAATALDDAFAAAAALHAGALAIGDGGLFADQAAKLAALAAHYALPAIAADRAFATAGGLMSYGSSATEVYHQIGAYCGLILKGAKAADLPVFRSMQFELCINLKTARSLGLVVPAALRARADVVIQ